MTNERKEAVVWAVEQLLDAAEAVCRNPDPGNLTQLNRALRRFGRGTLEVPRTPG